MLLRRTTTRNSWRFVERILNGVLTELKRNELYLVHVDNWFDHKWHRWWSTREELRIPTFTPNRICSEKHFVRNAESSPWEETELQKSLHVFQPGRPSLAKRLDRFSDSAAFVWYSGNTKTNLAGSLMLYLAGPEGYSWYASFRKNEAWTVTDGRHISPPQLRAFEKQGRRINHPQV